MMGDLDILYVLPLYVTIGELLCDVLPQITETFLRE